MLACAPPPAELGQSESGDETARPRLIVLTDIGGDPDDRQSMIRLLHYANEFEIEGLIASASGTPGELEEEVVKPELIVELADAYGLIRDNLALHDGAYPTADELRSRIHAGNPQRGLDHIGADGDTDGSRWIVEVVDRDTQGPVNIAIWGGQSDLAQALWRVRTDRGEAGLRTFIERVRVYDIADQDGIASWIMSEFPDLFYVLSKSPPGVDSREAAFRGMYLGGEESLTSREWIDEKVRLGHGPLGALYPTETWTVPNPHGVMKEGDTPSWFYFLPIGLGDPDHPEWGGWGGRFEHDTSGIYRDAADTVAGERHVRASVWRWRPAFQSDFAARLDWAVKPFDEVNHPPDARVVVEAADPASSGERIQLDASTSSDPDGDELDYKWFVYPEAGTYQGEVEIEGTATPRAVLVAPAVTSPETVHIVLAVTDRGEPRLTRYSRVVVRVQP